MSRYDSQHNSFIHVTLLLFATTSPVFHKETRRRLSSWRCSSPSPWRHNFKMAPNVAISTFWRFIAVISKWLSSWNWLALLFGVTCRGPLLACPLLPCSLAPWRHIHDEFFIFCRAGFTRCCHHFAKFLPPNHRLQQTLNFEQCDRNDMEWGTTPPRAPPFGGLLEADVKSIERLLIRQMSSMWLIFEGLSTIPTQIEASVNCRPLADLSTDPTDEEILTTGLFAKLTVLPEQPQGQEEFTTLQNYMEATSHSHTTVGPLGRKNFRSKFIFGIDANAKSTTFNLVMSDRSKTATYNLYIWALA